MASSQLLAAQARLTQLQTEVQAQKCQDVPWDTNPVEPVVACLALPSHLGWGSAPTSAILRRSALQQQKEQGRDTVVLQLQQNVQRKKPPFVQAIKQQSTQRPDWVNHYPSLGIAALSHEDTSAYRVWLMCRYLDDTGVGKLPVASLKAQLTNVGSSLRLFSWKRLKQVLYAGNGRFWHWNQTEQKIWLVGTAKLAQTLQVRKLAGMRVRLPVKTITAGIGEFRAHLYAAWHSGRRSENPISREVQRQLTHVPERTQRHYGRIAKIKTEKNIAIGGNVSTMAQEEAAWQRGQAVFVYTDRAGRFGSENGRYLAWQLPNSYSGPHQQAPFGRQQKINQRLKSQLQDLVEIEAQGNREKNDGQLYHANGSDAVRALKQSEETYWPTARKQQMQFWAVLQMG